MCLQALPSALPDQQQRFLGDGMAGLGTRVYFPITPMVSLTSGSSSPSRDTCKLWLTSRGRHPHDFAVAARHPGHVFAPPPGSRRRSALLSPMPPNASNPGTTLRTRYTIFSRRVKVALEAPLPACRGTRRPGPFDGIETPVLAIRKFVDVEIDGADERRIAGGRSLRLDPSAASRTPDDPSIASDGPAHQPTASCPNASCFSLPQVRSAASDSKPSRNDNRFAAATWWR